MIAEAEYLATDHRIDGVSYEDLEKAGATSIIAVWRERPLNVTLLGGKMLHNIPEPWIMRARRDLRICPRCAQDGPKVRRRCSHAD